MAVAFTVRIALSAKPPFADFLGLACFAVALAAPGITFLGAALPKVGFASLERATAGPAPVFDSVAFDRVALPLPGAGFLALVAIGQFPLCQHHCRI
ncbi:hypothetical protein [Mesorhizobium sp.]|uniref:hypothetical protein n=1 Tax=Mesorhizobium sp. TaxID=1871066 RepID=UPI0025DFC063|nr:hypothetical protein [Mesorhizobium sp.]